MLNRSKSQGTDDVTSNGKVIPINRSTRSTVYYTISFSLKT